MELPKPQVRSPQVRSPQPAACCYTGALEHVASIALSAGAAMALLPVVWFVLFNAAQTHVLIEQVERFARSSCLCRLASVALPHAVSQRLADGLGEAFASLRARAAEKDDEARRANAKLQLTASVCLFAGAVAACTVALLLVLFRADVRASHVIARSVTSLAALLVGSSVYSLALLRLYRAPDAVLSDALRDAVQAAAMST